MAKKISSPTKSDLLKSIKQTRLSYVKKWKEDIKKYQNHLKIETNPYAIKLKKEEIKRLRSLVNQYK